MKILLVKTSSLGDIVHTLPAVSDAKHQHPSIQFDWLVEEAFRFIPSMHPAVHRVITVSMRGWRRPPWVNHLPRIVRSIRALKHDTYDLIIDAQGLMKSGLLTRLGKGQRIGLSRRCLREPLAARFYDRHIEVGPNQHAIDRNRQLFAQALGYQLNDQWEYGLPIRRDQHQENPYLIFIHGTTWTSKQWPLACWRQLAQIACDEGLEVLLPWGTAEEQQNAHHIAHDIPRVKVLPRQTLEQLANLLINAEAVVSVDTGPGHLAAALGTPIVSIYGATDPALTGIRGTNQHCLQVDIQCAPCGQRTCRFSRSGDIYPKCYATVPAQQVWSTLAQQRETKISTNS